MRMVAVERDEVWFPESFDYIWETCMKRADRPIHVNDSDQVYQIINGDTWKSKVLWRNMIRLLSYESSTDAYPLSARNIPLPERKTYLSMENEEKAADDVQETYGAQLWLLDVEDLEESSGRLLCGVALPIFVEP